MLDLDNSRPEPNPNHPKLGDTIKVEPIRTVNAINKIKKALAPSPRNFAIFVVGINTAYRASELLSIRLGQVRHLQPGDRLEVKQKKTKKYRADTQNNGSVVAIQTLLEHLDRKALQNKDKSLSLIHNSEPTRRRDTSRMPSSA